MCFVLQNYSSYLSDLVVNNEIKVCVRCCNNKLESENIKKGKVILVLKASFHVV